MLIPLLSLPCIHCVMFPFRDSWDKRWFWQRLVFLLLSKSRDVTCFPRLLKLATTDPLLEFLNSFFVQGAVVTECRVTGVIICFHFLVVSGTVGALFFWIETLVSFLFLTTFSACCWVSAVSEGVRNFCTFNTFGDLEVFPDSTRGVSVSEWVVWAVMVLVPGCSY